jgi:flagellar export protein FliJ
MFRFRLQRVLDYRRLRVEHLENDAQQMAHHLQQEEARLAEFQAASQHQQEHLATLSMVCGEDLQMWHRYYRELAGQIAQQQLVVQEAVQALSAKQQELVTARQEEKVLEGMAEKAQQRYHLTLARHEQQLLDEIAIARSRYDY